MNAKGYIKLGVVTAFISFLLGTIIFLLYYFTSHSDLLLVGYGFIPLAGLVNIGILAAILIKAENDEENRNKLLSTCGVMLLNIPVLVFYCWITLILLGVMRITFINDTGTEISDINIKGCGGGHIKQLKAGESETEWVEITGDCSIHINYFEEGERKEEQVAGYVTSSMGQKLTHKINGQDGSIVTKEGNQD